VAGSLICSARIVLTELSGIGISGNLKLETCGRKPITLETLCIISAHYLDCGFVIVYMSILSLRFCLDAYILVKFDIGSPH
jgi:hypothetical protein